MKVGPNKRDLALENAMPLPLPNILPDTSGEQLKAVDADDGGEGFDLLTDDDLVIGGMEKTTAWVRSQRSKEELRKRAEAERQKRIRDKAAEEGAKPCSLGLVPENQHKPLKAMAKALRDGATWSEAIAPHVPEGALKTVEVERVVYLPSDVKIVEKEVPVPGPVRVETVEVEKPVVKVRTEVKEVVKTNPLLIALTAALGAAGGALGALWWLTGAGIV